MTGGTATGKHRILPGLFLILVLLPAMAQGDLRGEYSITGTGYLPGSGGYASPLNPGNLADLKDLSFQHRLSTRVSAGGGAAFIDLLIDLTPMLDPQSGTISPELFNLSLMRGAVSWYMGDGLKVTLGRQSLLTGYGYGWNPLDLANPLKDPADPEADLAGVDGITFHLLPSRLPVDLKLYGIAEPGVSGTGVDYDDISLGGEASFIGAGTEFKVTALYRFSEEDPLEQPKGSLGTGIFTDLGGAGFYAEAAVRDRSRTLFVQPGGDLETREGPVWSALGGFEYTFPGGLFATVEYFYNGEGYNRDERNAILAALEDPGLLAGLMSGSEVETAEFTALTELYRPGYYSRHYGLASLLYPLYEQNIDLSGTLLYSFDAGTLVLQPRVLWYASGGLVLEAAYGGLFDLTGDEAGEAALAPVKHALSLTGRFSF